MVFQKNILIILLAVTILGVAVFSFGYLPKNSFAFGLKIGSQEIGGLSFKEAKTKLEGKVSEFLESKINFTFSSKDIIETIQATPKEIGVNFDIDGSLEGPFKLGKPSNNQGGVGPGLFFQNLKEKFFALQGKYNFPVKADISNNAFEEFLTEKFGKYEIYPKNAEPIFNEKKLDFKIQEPKEGLLFEREKIIEEIKGHAQGLNINDIHLALKKTLPAIDLKEAQNAKEIAKDILNNSPYLLLIEGRVFVINEKLLGNWFSFLPQKKGNQMKLSVSLDEVLIGDFLNEISDSVNIEPQNPVLSFQEQNLKIVAPPKSGKTLDIKESTKKIQEKILNKETKIILSLTKAEPDITGETIKELEIETLVGSGNSNFAGSPKNRVHNIKIGASKFNGVLIGPNEEFSFNKILGEVGPIQGYLPELVIKENKTIPEYGGGICQVSTTMFRAAVNSGMEILERHPHAFPVRYYNPQGFDATVYLPSPDLRFKNNTPGYILIQSKIEGTKLTFEFYGKDDKRKVVVKGPYITWAKADGSMGTKLYQEVWRNGKIILQKTFLSSYKSPKLYPVQRNPLD